MLGEGGAPLTEFKAAARKFLARSERGNVDLAEYRAVIDSLEGDFGSEARDAQKAGAHLVSGNVSAASWIARTCKMSVTSAADRLRVGEQLESLPKVAGALASGEIGYQSVSVLAHLRDKLGAKTDLFDEDEMLRYARECSVSELRRLCYAAWHAVDPDGFFKEAEENFTRRRLHISQMADGMFVVDGLLDPVTGAGFRTALDALAKRKGPEDERKRSQRMHDAVGELGPSRDGSRHAASAQRGQAAHQPDHDHRGFEERGRRAAGRPRALAPDLDPHAGAHHLRLHPVARAAR